MRNFLMSKTGSVDAGLPEGLRWKMRAMLLVYSSPGSLVRWK